MRQFGWITGARAQETNRFSRPCNALARQSVHTLAGGQSASPYGVNSSNRAQGTLFHFFLVWFSACARHYDPVYGGAT